MGKSILFITLILLLFLSNYQSIKVKVISKSTAIRVKPGYAIKDDDSTFSFKGSKYYIITNETFDENGIIVKASVAGDVGYSSYTQKDFIKYKSLINDYSLTKVINVQLLINNNILVNGHKVITLVLNRVSKELYYNFRSKDTLYRITYK